MREMFEQLRQVTGRADAGPWWSERRQSHGAAAMVWSTSPGPVSSVARMGSATKNSPQARAVHEANARYVATFDPEVVTALLDVAEAAEDAGLPEAADALARLQQATNTRGPT